MPPSKFSRPAYAKIFLKVFLLNKLISSTTVQHVNAYYLSLYFVHMYSTVLIQYSILQIVCVLSDHTGTYMFIST